MSGEITTNARFDDLERILDRIKNPGNRQKRMITDVIRRMFQQNFTRQGSGAGSWAALRPSTVEDRRRQGYPGSRPILVREGDYRASFISATSPDHYENVFQDANGTVYEVGSKHPLGRVHELGTSKMAARPVTLLDARQENEIWSVLDFVVDMLDRELR